MAKRNHVVLVHGYSDSGASFDRWREALFQRGYNVTEIHTCSYESLSNEITIKDIAEGFDRALRIRAGLKDNEPFDAIVHSTGMLVIRAWLTAYNKRLSRLNRLIGLAPATFGSPLAHKGRSWLGAIFKGNPIPGPDFMEAGDLVLDGLELGSRFTWDLAETDLVGGDTYYGEKKTTPYVFVFCGNKGYGGLKSFISEPGTDGTVRWAGCALNSRKITIDLTRDPAKPDGTGRIKIPPFCNLDIPLVLVKGLNHGTIIEKPTDDLIDMVDRALQVSSKTAFDTWHRDFAAKSAEAADGVDRWQQIVVRALDERGDPITDYNIQLFTRVEGKNGKVAEDISGFDLEVHTYSGDKSLRCFHVNLTKLKPERFKNLWMRVIASSGTRFVGYHGYGSEKADMNMTRIDPAGKWDAEIEFSQDLLGSGAGMQFFYPYTTTLVEIRMNREPIPFDVSQANDLVRWI